MWQPVWPELIGKGLDLRLPLGNTIPAPALNRFLFVTLILLSDSLSKVTCVQDRIPAHCDWPGGELEELSSASGIVVDCPWWSCRLRCQCRGGISTLFSFTTVASRCWRRRPRALASGMRTRQELGIVPSSLSPWVTDPDPPQKVGPLQVVIDFLEPLK